MRCFSGSKKGIQARADTKEIPVASEDPVTIFPREEKTQTWLYIKGKDVEVWERVLNFYNNRH